MRRADRLFRIVQLLRQGRMMTAARLAEKLQVSTRTIYRDVMDLQLAGTPIEGEAGVGYTLRRDYDLPPLTFTSDELTALVLGARLVQAWGGAETVEAAKQALSRIEAVLPVAMRERLDAIQMYAPGFQMRMEHRRRLDLLHGACLSRNVVFIAYTKEDGGDSTRTIRPLALYFWSGLWTLVAWCELRENFRVFRLDRIRESVVQPECFSQKKGQRLDDFLKTVDRSEAARGAPPAHAMQ